MNLARFFSASGNGPSSAMTTAPESSELGFEARVPHKASFIRDLGRNDAHITSL